MTKVLNVLDTCTVGKFMHKFRIHFALESDNFSALIFYKRAVGLTVAMG